MINVMEETYQDFLGEMGEDAFLEPYRIACRRAEEKLNRINTVYYRKRGRYLICQMTNRIKTPESCLNKVIKKKCAIKRQTVQERFNDIAGIRVVCNSLDDIYRIVEILKKDEEFQIITIKDYIKNPKKSGYQSLHVIVLVPVDGAECKKVEIQIRTWAMNFWAVMEHYLVYKRQKGQKEILWLPAVFRAFSSHIKNREGLHSGNSHDFRRTDNRKNCV